MTLPLRRIALLALLTVGACSKRAKDVVVPDGTGSDTGTVPSEAPLAVTVAANDAAFVGATVVFYAADGAILGTETTDASGVATWPTFPSGGAVTVGIAAATNALVSVLDLEPGALAVDPTGSISSAPVGEIEVTMPAAFAGATSYRLRSGCTTSYPSAGETVTMQISGRCVDDNDRASVVALAEDADGTLAYSLQTDVFVSGITPATVELGDWQTDFRSVSVTATNPPASLDTVRAASLDLRDGIEIYRGDTTAQPAGPGPFAFTIDDVIGTLGAVGLSIDLDHVTTGGYSQSTYVQGFASPPAGLNVDLTQKLPPRLHETGVDVAAGVVSWTLDGTAPEADGFLSSLRWTVGTTSYFWYIHGPVPAETEYTLPALPPALESWRFTSLGDLDDLPSAAYYGSSELDGWPDLRDQFPPRFLERPFGGATPFEIFITSGG